jgi:hypothetical protein
MNKARVLTVFLVATVLFALAAPPGQGEWKNTTVILPVERLEKNVNAYIRNNPASGWGYYVLGRMQSMVFARAAKTLALNAARPGPDGKPGTPGFPPWNSVQEKPTGKGWKFDARSRRYLALSILNYRKASELHSTRAIYVLGLGWMLEQACALGADPADVLTKKELTIDEKARAQVEAMVLRLGADSYAEREKASKELRARIETALPILMTRPKSKDAEIESRVKELVKFSWEKKALTAYRRAFALAWKKDASGECLGGNWDWHASYESGRGILRLLARHEKTKAAALEIEKVKRHVSMMKAKPRKITPLIFSLTKSKPLAELLASGRKVRFDLDGDGSPSRWPWVKADTAFLVWDPSKSGRVLSGRQLFGSVTWWIPWSHGFQPLALLDDDGNGWLEGRELTGLALWQDRNSNGVSDPGEVRPLASACVTGLAVHPLGTIGGVPAQPHGVRMADGRVLPLYDWMPLRED